MSLVHLDHKALQHSLFYALLYEYYRDNVVVDDDIPKSIDCQWFETWYELEKCAKCDDLAPDLQRLCELCIKSSLGINVSYARVFSIFDVMIIGNPSVIL